MWSDIIKHLPQYPSAVLTFVDADGYPYSVRCQPEIDEASQVLHIGLADSVPAQAGGACLVAHYHNEELWDLKSITIRGELALGEEGWEFRPARFYAFGGAGSPLNQLKSLIKNGRVARRYLEKRGLERPEVPWAEYKALWQEAKGDR